MKNLFKEYAGVAGIALISAILSGGAGAYAQKASPRDTTDMGRDWRFTRGDVAGAEAVGFNDGGWQVVNLPHDFLIGQEWVEPSADEKPDEDNPMANIRSRLSARAFKEMGTGWYRKTFNAPAEWKGKRLLLDFEGIMLVGDVYLNGNKVGGTDYGYLGFEIDVTPYINFDGPNVIAVRADTGMPENSRWYTGAGLYRDVRVIATSPDQYFVRHPLQLVAKPAKKGVYDGDWTLDVLAEIATYMRQDSIRADLRVLGPDGKEVFFRQDTIWNNRKQKVREFTFEPIIFHAPALWNTENPNLYTFEMTLRDPQGKVTDSHSERFGFREVVFDPAFGMKLNGKKTLLKGIANHHTLGALGAAAYPDAIEKRIKLLKDFGFNHIRTSHNPYSEDFMRLCDENGILVVDELYDKWTKQFAGGRREWTELWQENVPEWVRRDRNHPSVVMWSLGNELQLIPDLPYNDWGVTPYRLQTALLHRYDTTRPVTVAMHPRGRNEKTDSIPAPLAIETPIAAYNYRYMYFPGDSRRYPDKMFYQSEANTSAMGPNFYEMDLDKVIGLAYWGQIDYLGESPGWPVKGWSQGTFDISLQPKPQAYFLKSMFEPDEPVVRMGIQAGKAEKLIWNDVQVAVDGLIDHWNLNEGNKYNVKVFTNADKVELFVNGRKVGEKENTLNPKKRNQIVFEQVEYVPGYIEAVAYKDGKRVAAHRMETAGPAKKLALTPEDSSWKADGTSLMHVRVTAVDSKGRRVPLASQEVTFTVTGDAEIVATDNGDNRSAEVHTAHARTLHNGTALVILRSGLTPGKVTLTATAPGYKAVKLPLVTL